MNNKETKTSNERIRFSLQFRFVFFSLTKEKNKKNIKTRKKEKSLISLLIGNYFSS